MINSGYTRLNLRAVQNRTVDDGWFFVCTLVLPTNHVSTWSLPPGIHAPESAGSLGHRAQGDAVTKGLVSRPPVDSHQSQEHYLYSSSMSTTLISQMQ